jgi:hypothetical protein
MLKTKEKIYIYNRNRIIYTKDNKSYFKYNRKYLLLNNDDDLYTNAESIVYKYIGGYIGGEGSVDIDSEENKKEEEEKKKKCQDFCKVFSKVIINKIKNIIKNKENYVLYINDIDKKVIEEEKKESDEQDKQKKKLGEKKCPHIDSKIINIYFIDNLFKKYIVDIIIDDNNINNILDNIYPTDNDNDNEKTEKNNCLKKIKNSIKNKKSFFDKFKDFWTKKKEENCEDIKYIDNEEDDYFKKDTFTKIKSELIIEYDKNNSKDYLQSIVNNLLNVEIFNYYTFYKEIMNIKSVIKNFN